jgi:hypothetical protein
LLFFYFQRWETQLKEHPHVVQRAAVMSPELCGIVLRHFQCVSPLEFQDKAAFCCLAFAGMRIEDIDCSLCKNISIVPHNATKKISRQ